MTHTFNFDADPQPSLSQLQPVQLASPLIKAAVNLEPESVRVGGKAREQQNENRV